MIVLDDPQHGDAPLHPTLTMSPHQKSYLLLISLLVLAVALRVFEARLTTRRHRLRREMNLERIRREELRAVRRRIERKKKDAGSEMAWSLDDPNHRYASTAPRVWITDKDGRVRQCDRRSVIQGTPWKDLSGHGKPEAYVKGGKDA